MPTATPAQLAQNVLLIRITMHNMGRFFEDDTRSGNHTSIFLITSNRASIRLNMTKAGATDTMGTYTISFCGYTDSNSSVTNIDITPVQGLTAAHFTQLITQNHRERYQLARSGVDCRFWVSTVINDMALAGYISGSSAISASRAREMLRYNYSKGKQPQFE
ncbi:hypothetical protein L228DRAFT_235983 [Xylona heveae TC161]|uniref:DUF7770 domain-containing protein n=1 Tax=Xylona heveae (strain CBS 132557 / TC161) TaxID=1328760 RepID=A0A165K4V7_XYLHT|nr:hypothetical protein L228DRAFT_235983 [Xylona heveae TC161]KZF26983.1 hypothetical protein L228DRAFT_235983 [Xylona heveae TC161]